MAYNNERGQSMVLLALAMVALLLFAGLALDAGVIYTAMVNLARAVDAAALAGVVELPRSTGLARADLVAEDFLRANAVTEYVIQSQRSSGPMGSYQYHITATQGVELYFLPLVGLETVRIRDRAVAGIDPQVSLYVSQAGLYGQVSTVNLAVFGPDSCTCYGDAYSPRYGKGDGYGNCLPRVPNPWWGELQGIYHFRLDLPPNYEGWAEDLTRRWNKGEDTNSILRVELWDPDTWNDPVSVSGCGGWIDPCTPSTGDEERPFEFVRIDENRGPNCTRGGSEAWWTTTRFKLYYFSPRPDGTLERVALATYTVRDDKTTDMQWISPQGFEFEIPDDIYISPDGVRSLFLDVQTLDGSSENGFDLWAGPRYPGVPSEVNKRNEWLVAHPGGHDPAGATWFGNGHLPHNSNSSESDVLITLAYVPAEWAGREIRVSTFDNDLDLAQDLTLSIDTSVDWSAPLELSGNGVWKHSDIVLPGPPKHTFYGGYLQVQYRAANAHDTFGWKVTTEGMPRLVE